MYLLGLCQSLVIKLNMYTRGVCLKQWGEGHREMLIPFKQEASGFRFPVWGREGFSFLMCNNDNPDDHQAQHRWPLKV